MKNKLQILAELSKIKITVFVTITTVLGYVLAAGKLDVNVILPALGLLLVACGSAVINHIQERKTDALMDRTKNRPLPSGRISVKDAVIISLSFLVSGFIILLYTGGLLAASLAMLNLVWYNVIYTPLKKVNPAAIVPGSLVGAIPPAVGWVCGGGNILDPRIAIISFFFFIWQIPHFWLLLLVLTKDYEKAGFPTLSRFFTEEQLSRITFMWITATVVTSLLIPLFGVVKNPLIIFPILTAGLWLTLHASRLLKNNKEKKIFRFAFRDINLWAIIVVILLSLDQLIILK